MVWKNGTPFRALTDGRFRACGNAIAACGEELVVAGFEHNGSAQVAKLWIQGTGFPLTDGTQNAKAEAVVVRPQGASLGPVDSDLK